MKNIIIYTLSDPTTKQVRYVGKTKCSIVKRFNHHIDKSKNKPTTHRDNWIKSLLLKGLLPIIEIIEEDAIDYESYWINQFFCWGFNLTNMTSGGEGRSSYKMPDSTKLKISLANKGNKHTEESKNKMSKSKTGVKWRFDLKRKENHRNALLGRKVSQETKNKIGLSNGMKIKCYKDGLFLSDFNTQAECARFLNIPKNKISEIITGNIKKYKNYTFIKI